MALPQKLIHFEGSWRVRREIEDRLGADARFEGEATFVPIAGGLKYRETGQLKAGKQSFVATREYVWRPSGKGVDVFFEDGRPFHQFTFGSQAFAGHDCAPDRYDVSYDFGDWPFWQTVWEVRGPRKDYKMTTRYEPLKDGD